MSNREKQFNISVENGSNTHLLRMGVVFLSIVSFYTTANGMNKYIFIHNVAVAYAASAAIQGILLALSMNLPGYLRNIINKDSVQSEMQSENELNWIDKAKVFLKHLPSKAGRFLVKFFLCVAALSLTLVTIFCSSWFSYIYIAEIIHKDSWDADSELLVQQAYRTELYNARDYAHNYRVYLEERVGEKILLLDEQAKELSEDDIDSTIEWDKERETYVTNNGTAAASYMSIVIDAMEPALTKGSENTRALAATAIADAKINIAERMEDIQQNLDTINTNITSYNTQITNLRNQISRAAEGTDTTALYNAINNYTQLIEDTSERQKELQIEYLQLDSALLRIPYYESELGLSSSTSYISIRSKLLQLQTEFFKAEPDKDKLLDVATGIFEDLRNATNAVANGDASEENFSYTNLLVQMNQLILNLKDYSAIKDIESELDRLITELRNENIADGMDSSLKSEENMETNESIVPEGMDNSVETISSAEASDDADLVENAGNTELEEPSESTLLAESVSREPDLLADSALPTDSTPSTETSLPMEGANSLESNESREETKAGSWQDEWGNKINDLKAQISAMPAYSKEKGADSGTVSALSEAQISVLANYDRDNSSSVLDDMTRRYISNHNAVYRGIIYLQSPYRSLALFALLLAVSFDLSGFVFGIVAQGSPQRDGNKDTSDMDETGKNGQMISSAINDNERIMSKISESGTNEQTIPRTDTVMGDGAMHRILASSGRNVRNNSTMDDSIKTAWSVLEPLTQYVVLTGDYESRDGIYYYKAFRDGLLYHWAVKDTVPYAQGIYIQEEADEEWEKGVALPEGGQTLLFAQQTGGPKDGIFMNCQLIYDEGSLILVQGDQKSFLANIDEYVPVHSYQPSQGENRTIPSKQLIKKTLDDQCIVVALNAKGTRIAAIYIVEHS